MKCDVVYAAGKMIPNHRRHGTILGMWGIFCTNIWWLIKMMYTWTFSNQNENSSSSSSVALSWCCYCWFIYIKYRALLHTSHHKHISFKHETVASPIWCVFISYLLVLYGKCAMLYICAVYIYTSYILSTRKFCFHRMWVDGFSASSSKTIFSDFH